RARAGPRPHRAVGRQRPGPRAGAQGLRRVRGGGGMTVAAVTRRADAADPAAFVGGLEAARTPGGPAWLAEARRRAAERFAASGLPTIRDEDWRFTDLRGMARHRFVPGTAGAAGQVGGQLAGLPSEGPRLVFVDGAFRAELSALDGLPEGVEAMPLSGLL